MVQIIAKCDLNKLKDKAIVLQMLLKCIFVYNIFLNNECSWRTRTWLILWNRYTRTQIKSNKNYESDHFAKI